MGHINVQGGHETAELRISLHQSKPFLTEVSYNTSHVYRFITLGINVGYELLITLGLAVAQPKSQGEACSEIKSQVLLASMTHTLCNYS